MRSEMSELKEAVPHVSANVRAVPSGAMLDVFVGGDVGATLNAQARCIFELVDGVSSIDTIIARMAGEYDAPVGEISEDVCEVVLEMKEIGLLTW